MVYKMALEMNLVPRMFSINFTHIYIYIPNSFAYNHVYAGHIFDTTRCVKSISVKIFNKSNNKSFTNLCKRLSFHFI